MESTIQNKYHSAIHPTLEYLQKRFVYADYVNSCPNIWGGTKFGMDSHLVSRIRRRWTDCTGFDGAMVCITNLLEQGGAELEDEVIFGLNEGAIACIAFESAKACVFLQKAQNWDPTSVCENAVFVYSLYRLRPGETTFFCTADAEGRFLVHKDGTVEKDPDCIQDSGNWHKF